MRNLIKSTMLVAAMTGFGTASFAQMASDPAMTVIENAASTSDFSTLITALTASGLTEELMGSGPYTIFAPTNAAFDQLVPGTLEQMLLPENQERLIAMVKAHIVLGTLTDAQIQGALVGGNTPDMPDGSFEVVDGSIRMPSLSAGSDVFITKTGSGLYVTANETTKDNAAIIGTEMVGSNGIIHTIDAVLMPNS